MGRDIFLSVVIPVFNESGRIYHLDEVLTFFGGCDFPFETIVVDDGSRDDTLQKLAPWRNREGVKVFSYLQNRGKGYAIRTGMGAAAGEFRLFMDIDLSTPLDEFRRFEPFLRSHDITGTGRTSRATSQHQPGLRETWASGIHVLSRHAPGLAHGSPRLSVGQGAASSPA
jgi:glycosyltransferase involved in cell wall biosynthesis